MAWTWGQNEMCYSQSRELKIVRCPYCETNSTSPSGSRMEDGIPWGEDLPWQAHTVEEEERGPGSSDLSLRQAVSVWEIDTVVQQPCSPVNMAGGCQAHQQKGYSSQGGAWRLREERTQQYFLQYLLLLGTRNEVLSYLGKQETGRVRRDSSARGAICKHTFAAEQCLNGGSKDSVLPKGFQARAFLHGNFFLSPLPSTLCPLCYKGIN